MLKPKGKWRVGMTHEKLMREMDSKLQFPVYRTYWNDAS